MSLEKIARLMVVLAVAVCSIAAPASAREYLLEESGDVPSKDEVEAFGKRVNTLRDDVERLAARIDRLGGRG